MQNLKRSQFRINRLLVLAAVLILPASAANLSGTIVYKTGGMANPAPLAQAMISVYSTVTGAKSVTLSSDQGAYLFTKLGAGSYIVIVEKKGRRLYQGRVELREPASRFDIRL